MRSEAWFFTAQKGLNIPYVSTFIRHNFFCGIAVARRPELMIWPITAKDSERLNETPSDRLCFTAPQRLPQLVPYFRPFVIGSHCVLHCSVVAMPRTKRLSAATKAAIRKCAGIQRRRRTQQARDVANATVSTSLRRQWSTDNVAAVLDALLLVRLQRRNDAIPATPLI